MQSSIGVRMRNYSEDMQLICRKRAPMPKCDFNKVANTILLKSHFGQGFLMKICCVFSEYLFIRTHPEDSF